MKKILSGFGTAIIAIGIIGGVAGGGYFIYKAVVERQKEEEHIFIPKVHNNLNGYDLEIAEDWSEKEYLGQTGIDLIKQKIEKELGFGPEVVGLNSINFTNYNHVSDTDNGAYYSSTKQIFINTSNIAKIVPYDGTTEDKVEIAFQILFHEYGHHIADSYFKKMGTGTEAADIYFDSRRGRTKEGWNPEFVRRFKEDLGYDRGHVSSNSNIYNSNGTISKYKMLSGTYGLKELFDISNAKAQPGYTKDLSNVVWTSSHPVIKISDNSVVQTKNLKYMFDLDELFTRKYQQMRYDLNYGSRLTPPPRSAPPSNPNKDMYVGWMNKNGWVRKGVGGSSIASPFLSDTLKYQNEISSNSSRYYEDAPYRINPKTHQPIAKDLFNIYINGFGQNTGSDIAFITNKNDYRLISSTHYSKMDGAESANDKIKFGGYITQAEAAKYKFVGYMSNNRFVSLPITAQKFNVGYKSNSLIGQVDTYPAGDNYFYTTNNWYDEALLDGKQLFFSEDSIGSNKQAMSSVKSGSYGDSNTWFYDTPSELQDKTFRASKNGKIVSIRAETWRR